MENELPCLDMLEATPDLLRGLMCELDREDACWKPAPDRFSIAEVLAHLSHTEGHCYRARLDRMLSENRPALESYEIDEHRAAYAGADPEDSFDHFEEQRESNVEFLRTLEATEGERVAVHPAAGEITLSNMLHAWALHDLGHVRQIAELVRARKYFTGAGPLAKSYQVKP